MVGVAVLSWEGITRALAGVISDDPETVSNVTSDRSAEDNSGSVTTVADELHIPLASSMCTITVMTTRARSKWFPIGTAWSAFDSLGELLDTETLSNRSFVCPLGCRDRRHFRTRKREHAYHDLLLGCTQVTDTGQLSAFDGTVCLQTCVELLNSAPEI